MPERLFPQVFPLALIEALRQLLSVEDPRAAALEETVVTRQERGDHAPSSAARDVRLGKQRYVFDAFAIVLHDLAQNVERRKFLLVGATAEIDQLVHPIAA